MQELFKETGCLLISNTGITTVGGFSEFAFKNFIDAPLKYLGGTNNRIELAKNAMNVGIEPAHLNLAVHNEMAYLDTMPTKIIFACVTPPERGGGATTIAPTYHILSNLPLEMRTRFEVQGVMYRRVFTSAEHPPSDPSFIYNHWQVAFSTNDKSKVDELCHKNSWQWEWQKNDVLSTCNVLPAIRIDPITGNSLFLNQAYTMNAKSWFDGWEPFTSMPPHLQPFTTYWGDGTPFSEVEMQTLKRLHEEHLFIRPWKQGDLHVLDNLRWAHGRTPYTPGDTRVICVMMGDGVSPLPNSEFQKPHYR